MAKGKRYSEDPILKVLQEIEAGASLASVGPAHGMSVQTIYPWRERYQGVTKSELSELKCLQEENRRLKHRVAELSLDNATYQEIGKGKW